MDNWKDLGTAWLDELTGLTWSKEFKANLNHHEAETWAKEQGKRLPTQDEFKIAELHKIRELSSMDWADKWFWSSTLYPGDSVFAYLFYGYDGYADGIVTRAGSGSKVAARCVSDIERMP